MTRVGMSPVREHQVGWRFKSSDRTKTTPRRDCDFHPGRLDIARDVNGVRENRSGQTRVMLRSENDEMAVWKSDEVVMSADNGYIATGAGGQLPRALFNCAAVICQMVVPARSTSLKVELSPSGGPKQHLSRNGRWAAIFTGLAMTLPPCRIVGPNNITGRGR